MSPPRKAENKGLPANWARKHGAYYFRVPAAQKAAWDGRQWFRLGKSLPEAFRVYASRVDSPKGGLRTVGDLLDRYELQSLSKLAVTTQAGYRIAIAKLRPVFGSMPIREVKPSHVYRYVEKRTKKVAAHREVEVLSAAFTAAVSWGEIDRHPFKGEVRLAGEAPRTRYVTDEELAMAQAIKRRRKGDAVPVVQAYLRLKMATGLRQGDILRLTVSDLKDDGVHVTPGKTAGTTAKAVVFTWTEELRAAVAQAKDARPALSPFLFCTRRGAGYMNEATGRAPGWKSIWQRFQDRIAEAAPGVERFTEHDLRAKVGSDAPTLDRAQQLLTHADAATTKRVYRRKVERIVPAK